jgi:hypothetical protein
LHQRGRERRTVDVNRAAADLDRLAGQGDHALDEATISARLAKYDHVAAADAAHARRQLVDQESVAALERRRHAARR